MSGPGGLGPSYFTFLDPVVCSHTRLQESRKHTANKFRTQIEEGLASLEREFASTVESRYEDARESFSAAILASIGAAHRTVAEFESGLASSAAAAIVVDAIVGPVKRIATAAAWQSAASHDDYPRAKLSALVRNKMDWNALRWSTHLDELLGSDPRAIAMRPAFEDRWASDVEFMDGCLEDFEGGRNTDLVDLSAVDFFSRTSAIFATCLAAYRNMDEMDEPNASWSPASSRASSPGPDVGELLPALDFGCCYAENDENTIDAEQAEAVDHEQNEENSIDLEAERDAEQAEAVDHGRADGATASDQKAEECLDSAPIEDGTVSEPAVCIAVSTTAAAVSGVGTASLVTEAIPRSPASGPLRIFASFAALQTSSLSSWNCSGLAG
ncbi:hypothetical protein DFJ73DRAFT_42272 [Zopfochytrium polystomum]|nr:hypothetical protein DFJ73DRAFT_42272 [Zopfochytrium polystomum]